MQPKNNENVAQLTNEKLKAGFLMLEINFVLIYFFGKNFHNFFYTKYYNISQSTAWKTIRREEFCLRRSLFVTLFKIFFLRMASKQPQFLVVLVKVIPQTRVSWNLFQNCNHSQMMKMGSWEQPI